MLEWIKNIGWWLFFGALDSLCLPLNAIDPCSEFRLDPTTFAVVPKIMGLLIWLGVIYVLTMVISRRRSPLARPQRWTQVFCAIGLLGYFVSVGERVDNSRDLNGVMYWRGIGFDASVWANAAPNGTHPVELRSLMVGSLASKGRVLGKSKDVVVQQLGTPDKFDGANCMVYELGKTSCRFKWGVGNQDLSLRVESINDVCVQLSLIQGGTAVYTASTRDG